MLWEARFFGYFGGKAGTGCRDRLNKIIHHPVIPAQAGIQQGLTTREADTTTMWPGSFFNHLDSRLCGNDAVLCYWIFWFKQKQSSVLYLITLLPPRTIMNSPNGLNSTCPASCIGNRILLSVIYSEYSRSSDVAGGLEVDDVVHCFSLVYYSFKHPDIR